jgi:hypothetical protein
MNNLKKGLSLFLAALFVMVSTLVAAPVKAEEAGNIEILPEIEFAVQAHYPLYVGETQSVYVKSNYEGQVQYRAFLKEADGTWSEVTEGYTEAVDANEAYPIISKNEYKAGDNYFVVWVKRAGVEDAELAHNTAVIKESEIPALKDQKKCYDNFSFIKMTALEGEDEINLKDVEVKVDGTKVSVAGNEEVNYAIQARNLDATEASEIWLEKAEYTKGSAERELTEGNYLVSIWAAKDANAKYPDAYKLVAKNIETKTAKTVEVLSTELKDAMFGQNVTVTMLDGGKEVYANAAKYEIYDGEKKISTGTPVALGEAITIFSLPKKADGDEVTIKLLDADGNEVEALNVKLGETVTKEVANDTEEDKPAVDVDYELTATVADAMFGQNVTVKVAAEYEGVAKYEIYDGEKKISTGNPVALGETITIFSLPKKVAGDEVTVKLLDAEGNAKASVNVALSVAE